MQDLALVFHTLLLQRSTKPEEEGSWMFGTLKHLPHLGEGTFNFQAKNMSPCQ